MITKYLRKFTPRYWSNDVLHSIADHLPQGLEILNVSGWDDRDKEGSHYRSYFRSYFRSPAAYHISNYPDDSARGANVHSDVLLDLQKPLPAELKGAYDVVLNHTVLEHVADPQFAFRQIADISSDLDLHDRAQ